MSSLLIKSLSVIKPKAKPLLLHHFVDPFGLPAHGGFVADRQFLVVSAADIRLITFFFFFGRFFNEMSQGTEGDAEGKRKESGEAQWELLEQREADGKTDPNRSENSFCVRLEADNSLKPL